MQHTPPQTETSSIPPVRIKLFGHLSVTWGASEISAFAYDKVRALLGYLAATPGVHHRREAIADLLWPEASAEAARNNLRRAVFELRRIFIPLQVMPIVSDRHSLGFEHSPRVSVDFADFLEGPCTPPSSPEAAALRARQIELYRARLLDGLHVPDSLEFNYWLQSRREAMHQHALGLLDGLVTYHRGQGSFELAIGHARRKVELEPWIEANYCQLMQLHADNGNIGRALQVFNDCQSYLQRELGLEPEGDTMDFARRLRRQYSSLGEAATRPTMERNPLTILACRILVPQPPGIESCFPALSLARAACADIAQLRNGRLFAMHSTLLVAFFGYPTPREQAPREAIDAALDMRAKLGSIGEMEGIGAKITVHGGWGLLDENYLLPDASGELLQHALSMLDPAKAGEIRVTASVFESAASLFEATLAEPGVYLVQGRAGWQRFASAAPRQTPLVGRRQEMKFLLSQWQLALGSGFAMTHVSGEPGIGKSCLVSAFSRQVKVKCGSVLLLRCLADEEYTPYYPIAAGLQQYLDVQPYLPAGQRLEILRHRLSATTSLEKHLPVMSRLLGLPSAMDAITDPFQLRHAMEQAITNLFDALSAGKPMLIVLEDLHWADPETHALLRASGKWHAHGHHTPQLIVTSSRHPEVIAQYVPHLALSPLSPEESRELANVAGDGRLPPERLAEIARRGDGVPLYIEQLVRCIEDQDAETVVPDTLRDLLAARIASQGEHRKVAQAAAVIGRDFDLELLSALWGEAAEQLQAGLVALNAHGLIQLLGQSASFRHALIRDAAYLSLTLDDRRTMHLRLTRVLQSQFPELVEQRPELVAKHLSEARDAGAAKSWLAAAGQAAGLSMQDQANHFFERGIEALTLVPDPVRRNDLEFRLQVGRGNALIALKGYGNAASREAYARALSLIGQLSGDSEIFRVLWGLWLGGRSIDATEHPLTFAHRLAEAARNSDDPGMRLQVNYAYGNNHFWLGCHDEARRHLETAVRLAPLSESADLIASYGEHSGISAMAFLCWVDWVQGKPDNARQRATETVAAARAIGHAHSTCFALAFTAVLYRYLRLPGPAREFGQELAELANTHGLRLWQASAAAILGWAAAVTGDESGLQAIRAAIAGARQAMPSVTCTFLAFLADALHALGRLDEADMVIDESIDTAHKVKDFYLLPEFHRLKGEIALGHNPQAPAAARQLFEQGLALANEQGARILALRLASSLARLVEPEAARILLDEHCRSISGGDDLPDLRAAREMLAALG